MLVSAPPTVSDNFRPRVPLIFTTESLGATSVKLPTEIQDVLSTDCFGKFAILAKDSLSFIQAGNAWSASDECSLFLSENDSDPWILEYREAGRQHFRAKSLVTLAQVIEVFTMYFRGDLHWKTGLFWESAALNEMPTT